MVDRVETAYVKLWGNTVGAVVWLPDRQYAVFEYTPEFLKLGLEIAPLTMPAADALAGNRIFSFPALNRVTFKGLPGLLADALPDKFGNAIIDAWLARQGRSPESFSPIERLCYTGRRGMGALEFQPAVDRGFEQSAPVEINALVELAQAVTSRRSRFEALLEEDHTTSAEAITDILRVGTSAGGARPKAIIALDAEGNVRSGQVEAPPGYDYWLLKFDGVNDLELGKPMGYGRIEYAYYLMARAAGIEIAESRLHEENGRAHFLTRRFDRVNGQKLHMLSLCGIAHFDFNLAGAYAYEQIFTVMRQLGLPKPQAIQQYRRMVFNILARNQDDHTKNVAFLMDRTGQWRLAPAFDVTYSHNPSGQWTNQHQMTINGKRTAFSVSDIVKVGHSISIKKPQEIIDQVADAVSRWPTFAREAGVPESRVNEVASQHRVLS